MESFFAKMGESPYLENITSDTWPIYIFCLLLLLSILGGIVYVVRKRDSIMNFVFDLLDGENNRS